VVLSITTIYSSISRRLKAARFHVIFSRRALEQILELERYIAETSYPSRAERFIDGLVDCCEQLSSFPHRGIVRNDIRPGLRVTNYRKRTAIAFVVQGDSVEILGIFHGGRDYAALLRQSGVELPARATEQ
jgi:toxin ParE1/3/4